MKPHKPYTHVWFLEHNVMTNGPSWGWVAIGPGGHHAGAERTADKACEMAQCARFLICGDGR